MSVSHSPTITKKVRITGRVQGVGYRAWTERTAIKRGLNGTVQNLPDGSVEACFQGSEAGVQDMLASCLKGPTFAKVSAVEELPHEEQTFSSFTILR